MRLFLAIDLPAHLKKDLQAQLHGLQREYRQFSWTPPENYHITLHFIGDVAQAEPVIEKIERAIFDIDPFQMYAAYADLFMHRKIILHLTFARSKVLEKLVAQVKHEFAEESRLPFVPHLTFARYKIPSKQQYLLLQKKLGKISIDLEFPVESLTLFESISGARQPVYKEVAKFSLIK